MVVLATPIAQRPWVVATPSAPLVRVQLDNCNDGADCPQPTGYPFSRVVVNNLFNGGTRVAWELTEGFHDVLPYTFQLQVGTTGVTEADDWQDVGLPAANVFYAIDGEKRNWGKTNWTHYRIKLTTLTGIYYSIPAPGLGVLTGRDFRLYQEVIRKELLRFQIGAGQNGFLLKRKVSGQRCPVCLDLQTMMVRQPFCPTCYGTSFVGGYYDPHPCVWADLSLEEVHTMRDNQAGRGTVADIVISARMLGAPQLFEGDVWVDQNDDRRYYVHKIKSIVEFRGVPTVYMVELRPAAASDTIYEILIPDQQPALVLF